MGTIVSVITGTTVLMSMSALRTSTRTKSFCNTENQSVNAHYLPTTVSYPGGF